jgi:AmiR/NasT family two-component response regulator
MVAYGYGEPEAYKRMRNMAMNKGKRISEVAEAIILANELGITRSDDHVTDR